jgi:NADH-quinone oxidoreductase subunit L
MAPVHWFLWNKWFFDQLYDLVFVQNALRLSRLAAAIDRRVIDGIADGSAHFVRGLSQFDELVDRYLVDGLVNTIAYVTYQIGLRLRPLQSGRLRQYVMMIALGTVTLFLLITLYWQYALAAL